jgi:methionine synthase II (cobalamin-independent)
VFEDMNIQYSEGLPLLEIIEEKRALSVSSSQDRESQLLTFYDRFLADDADYFAISPQFAAGLYGTIELIGETANGRPAYIKGQSTGPITFSASISDTTGNPLLFNPELLEAMVRGLAVKALWQVRRLEDIGQRVIFFLDEPYLSGYGSAFTPVGREAVVENLRFVVDYLKERTNCLVGIHCCGNTDWPMILEAGPHIVNFDAFEYLDLFLLYPKEIRRFIESGGTIAWGIVPTSDAANTESVESLRARLAAGIERLAEWGIDPRLTAERSILTTSCGMGTMTPAAAETALSLLSQLSKDMRKA